MPTGGARAPRPADATDLAGGGGPPTHARGGVLRLHCPTPGGLKPSPFRRRLPARWPRADRQGGRARMAIRRLVQRLKGGSSHNRTTVLAHLRKPFWGGRHIWARGTSAPAAANPTDEVIKANIEHQDHEQQDGDSRVEGEPAAEGWATPRLQPTSAGNQGGFSRNRDLQSQIEATASRRWSGRGVTRADAPRRSSRRPSRP